MNKIKKKRYFRRNYAIFINSFKKIDKNIVYSVLFDLIFILLLMIGGFMLYVLASKISLPNPPLLDPKLTSIAELQKTISELRGIFISVAVYLIIFLLYATLIWSLSRSLIWGRISNNRFSLKLYEKFSLLNMVWLFLWLILFAFILTAVKISSLKVIIPLFFFLVIYFTMILYASFFGKLKIFSSIKEAFATGIKKIYLIILPFLISLFMTLIIIAILYIIISLMPIYFKIIFPLALIAFLFYLGWLRVYSYGYIIEFCKKD